MKGRIGILTYHDINNYGAQLQATSIQKFTESLGYKSELIDYTPIRARIRIIMTILRPLFRLKFKSFTLELKKRIRFWKSIRRMSHLSKKTFYSETSAMKYCYEQFDYLICGSDELWNFNSYLGYRKSYILDFKVADKVKKISYAASMGNCEPNDELTSKMQSSLKQFSSILVRDPYTKEFVDGLKVGEVTRVADPTLIWDVNAAQVNTRQPYLLLTGALMESQNVIEFAKSFAVKNDLKIITIGAKPESLEHTVIYATPEEWIGYINNAAYHITSLFHGSIFSMKSKTKFAVVVPEEKQQKITSLLSWFAQEIRLVNPSFTESEITNALASDYNEVFQNLMDGVKNESQTALVAALGSN